MHYPNIGGTGSGTICPPHNYTLFRRFFILNLLLFVISKEMNAQSYPIEVRIEPSSYEDGDSVYLVYYAGEEEEPLFEVSELTFLYEYPDFTTSLHSLYFADSTDSWFLTGEEWEVSTSEDSSTTGLRVSLSRPYSSPASGYGQVVRIGPVIVVIDDLVLRKTRPVTDCLSSELLIYPLPAKEYIHLKNSCFEINSVKLYAADGKLAYSSQGRFKQETLIPVSNLSPGIYWLIAHHSLGIVSKPLLLGY